MMMIIKSDTQQSVCLGNYLLANRKSFCKAFKDVDKNTHNSINLSISCGWYVYLCSHAFDGGALLIPDNGMEIIMVGRSGGCVCDTLL